MRLRISRSRARRLSKGPFRSSVVSPAGERMPAILLVAFVLVVSLLPAGQAAAEPRTTEATPKHPSATLRARATLSADYLAPGPPSGAKATPANGRRGPFAGQV